MRQADTERGASGKIDTDGETDRQTQTDIERNFKKKKVTRSIIDQCNTLSEFVGKIPYGTLNYNYVRTYFCILYTYISLKYAMWQCTVVSCLTYLETVRTTQSVTDTHNFLTGSRTKSVPAHSVCGVGVHVGYTLHRQQATLNDTKQFFH